MANPIFTINEYDYQTGEWVCVEYTATLQIALDRLEWHLINNSMANHRIHVIEEIPAPPW